MEALKELMAKRRAETERLKQMAGVAAASNGRKKFVRRRDLERARKAEFLATQRKEDEKDVLRKHKVAGAIDDKGQIADVGGSSATPKRSRRRRDDDAAAGVGAGAGAGQAASPAATPTPKRDATGSNPESPAVELPKEEVVKRLRQLELPVTLFGESDGARLRRMRAAETQYGEGADGDDMRLGAGHDIGNVFLDKKRKMNAVDLKAAVSTDAGEARAAKKARKAVDSAKEAQKLQSEKVKNDPSLYCKYYFKKLLKEWEHELALRPESEMRTAAGRNVTATHKQCKDYMRPFFKMCKNHELSPPILQAVRRIITNLEAREYVKANDEYVLLAIGNAPWPMGVTSIGIHERAARTKIFVDKVAHVMNDECQRKYITSIKRLMTFAQRHYPAAPSKMVM